MKCRFALAMCGALLGACASTPPVPRYYLLESSQPMSSAAPASAGATLAVGPVSVASYLDQPLLVTRDGNDVLRLNDGERWAMPLEDSAREVLVRRLSERLPDTDVVTFPGAADADRAAYRVAIEILRLDGEPGGAAAIDARWRLYDASRNTPRELRPYSAQTAVGDGTVRALVAAESALVAGLADAIALVLEARGQPAGLRTQAH